MHMKWPPPRTMRTTETTKKRKINSPMTGKIHQKPHIGPIHGPGPHITDSSSLPRTLLQTLRFFYSLIEMWSKSCASRILCLSVSHGGVISQQCKTVDIRSSGVGKLWKKVGQVGSEDARRRAPALRCYFSVNRNRMKNPTSEIETSVALGARP